ncbi:MAG: hypothetical protein AAF902_22520, partial [Chloroflexota bacterium]
MNEVLIQPKLPVLGLSPADAIIQTIRYAQIFDQPLSVGELHQYLIGLKLTAAELDNEVERLVSAKTLIKQGSSDWIALRDNEYQFAVRAKREERAKRLWPLAKRYGHMIGRLPFVRMVAVTGSLAVNNPDKFADIDLFVITEPDRLWLARLLTISVVKLAAHQEIHLCPNYFITTNNLEIDAQNLYTAREICQMVPLVGQDV